MNITNPNQVHQLWLEAAEKVKDRIIAPSLYIALEHGIGIAVEGDEFILGFSNADFPMAGHLRSGQHLAIIERCLTEVVRKKVRLKIVEGTTLADYENYKKLKAATEATLSSMSARRERDRTIELAWEEVGEKITRGYAKLQLRQLAQSRAQFVVWAFGVINEAVNKLKYNEKSDEASKRSLSRIFEKFSTVVEVPSTMLAYEFFKLRDEGKLPK